MNWTYYTNNNYSIVPDDGFYSGCWNINHYYPQQSFSRQFWYYQLSWQRTLATVESFKADVSSVNPSSERSCDDWTTRSNLQLQMPFESKVRERFVRGYFSRLLLTSRKRISRLLNRAPAFWSTDVVNHSTYDYRPN